MAVKAAGSVTVASITDVASTTRYYLLQASTLTAPAKPTAKPPGGSWSATEPTYTEGSTNSLYTCDQTVFSDGTFAYSSVSLSSSYEAAKAAYNKAVAAANAAATTDQHFWADSDGAHVSSTGDHDLSGPNLLLTSAKLAFRNALSELFSIIVSGTSAIISFLGGKLMISYGLWDSEPLDTSVIDASDNDLKITSDVGVISGSFYDRSTFNGSYTNCTPHQYELVGDSFKISNNVPSGSTDHVGLVVDPKRIATVLGDSGQRWINGPYGDEKQGCNYRKMSGLVVVAVDLGGDSAISVGSNGTLLGTLPTGCRPASTMVTAASGKGTGFGQMTVAPDGTVRVWNFGSTSVWFGGSIIYPASD